MQILAGIYKGRKIRSSSSLAIRPCSSRVKKSLFDIITARIDFEGISVLDLFAGFGSLGFEALSRGAGAVCFVDQHVDALKAMKATTLQFAIRESIKIVNSDVMAFLGHATGPFDLLFCDPPYSWPDYERLIEKIFANSLLSQDGLVLMEHSAHLDFSQLPYYSFHRDYGMTRVTFFQH